MAGLIGQELACQARRTPADHRDERAERSAGVGQQRAQRPMRVDQQPGGSGQTAPLSSSATRRAGVSVT